MGKYFFFPGNIILGEKTMRSMHILIAVFAVVVVLVLSQSPSISFSLALAIGSVLFFVAHASLYWRERDFYERLGGKRLWFPFFRNSDGSFRVGYTISVFIIAGIRPIILNCAFNFEENVNDKKQQNAFG